MRYASVPSSIRLSLNQGCFKACLAVIRCLGSYTKIFWRRSRNARLNGVLIGMNSCVSKRVRLASHVDGKMVSVNLQ